MVKRRSRKHVPFREQRRRAIQSARDRGEVPDIHRIKPRPGIHPGSPTREEVENAVDFES